MFDDNEIHGWVTACNPSAGLMIGYLWKTEDYPWLNLWRYEYRGNVTARGLEFGKTGYHQPFEVLLEQGKILGQGLFDYLDAGETAKRSYAAFLLKVPSKYRGAADVRLVEGTLRVVERGDSNPRIISLRVGKLFDE